MIDQLINQKTNQDTIVSKLTKNTCQALYF
jgi:hypothetical protein